MSDPSDPAVHPPLSRRQFGAIVAGGAALVAVGTGLVATTGAALPGAALGARTSFGSVAIERAKRFARFKPGTFPGVPDTGPTHGHPSSTTDPSRAPVNLTWPDVVVLWLAVTNSSRAPVLLSPGQLRLWIVGSGTTVAPRNYASDRVVVPAGRSTSTWVSYLSPASAGSGFLGEFVDPALDGSLALRVPAALTAAEAPSDTDPWAV